MSIRFAEPCRAKILDFEGAEHTIHARTKDLPPPESCQQDIFLGLFFDGTNNNKYRDTAGYGHSNVARLYEAFIGQGARQTLPALKDVVVGGRKIPRVPTPDKDFKPADFPAEEYPYYRKIYVPGVGTPCPDVGDSGTDLARSFGLAMSLMGEARLCWALLQVVRQTHAALTGRPGSDAVRFKPPPSAVQTVLSRFDSDLFNTLGSLMSDYARALDTQLRRLEAGLAPVAAQRVQNRPRLRRIRLSIFGFSRGAAEARAFANRVVQRWGGTLCGIPLVIDFMGLFDTVASVGLAQSVPTQHGHGGWASGENLTVPAAVARCVHLVAAHEVRASFPLDSICRGGTLASNCKEIVYPGVHSDVGGGYPPGDQGRALGQGPAGDGKKLSQIALAQMYREARMAGVPLGAPGQFDVAYRRDNFNIDPQLRADFNAYVEATRTGLVPATDGKGPDGAMFPTERQPRHRLEDLMATHYGYYLRWRKARLGAVHALPHLAQNPNASRWQDIEDIRGADEELVKELAFLNDPDPEKFEHVDDPTMEAMVRGLRVAPAGLIPVFGGALQVGGAVSSVKIESLLRKTMEEKQRQWDLCLKAVWDGPATLSESAARDAARLFEHHLHDSRAWFKALLAISRITPSAGLPVRQVKSILGIDGYEMAPDDEDWFALGGREAAWEKERKALQKRMAAQSEAGDWLAVEISRQALQDLEERGLLVRGGREPYRMYGYLRFRRVYQSGQLNAMTHARRLHDIEANERARYKQQRIEQEKARHDAEVQRIQADSHRVIRENRLPQREQDAYLYGARQAMSTENARHADNMRVIEARP